MSSSPEFGSRSPARIERAYHFGPAEDNDFETAMLQLLAEEWARR